MKIILSLSGGMDSATLLAAAVALQHEVLCVTFRYGSKHNSHESRAAAALIQHYHCPSRAVDLTGVFSGFRSNLLLGQGKVPEGHYEAQSMEQTVVPARNIIFASVLAGVAWSEGAEAVWLGAHAGDHAIYPDCRPEFITAMDNAIHYGTGHKVRLYAPFLCVDKAEILRQGLLLQTPYHLTRTCYQDQELACGRCGSCQERLTAFATNGLNDPLPYASRAILPREV